MIHIKPTCPRCLGTLILEEGVTAKEGAYTDMVCISCGIRFYRVFDLTSGEYVWEEAGVGAPKYNPLLKTYLVSEEQSLD